MSSSLTLASENELRATVPNGSSDFDSTAFPFVTAPHGGGCRMRTPEMRFLLCGFYRETTAT